MGTKTRSVLIAVGLASCLLCLSSACWDASTPPAVSTERIACQVEWVDTDIPCPPIDTKVYVLRGDGTGRKEIGRDIGEGGFPAWSPDGRALVMVGGCFDTLCLVDVGSGAGTQLASLDTDIDSPEWSPSGGLIAFRANETDIWIISEDGSGLQRLTENEVGAHIGPASWSPDGSRIAYSLSVDGLRHEPAQIYVMSADGSGVAELTHGSVSSSRPRWSPKGDRIAFQGEVDGQLQIWIMNRDGSERSLLARGLLLDWSPDGHMIFFHREAEIFSIDPEGSTQTSLGEGVLYGWSPDGTRLYFHLPGDDFLWTMSANGSGRARVFELGCEDPVWSPVLESHEGRDWFGT